MLSDGGEGLSDNGEVTEAVVGGTAVIRRDLHERSSRT